MKQVISIVVVSLLCLCGCSLNKRIQKMSQRVEKMYETTREWSELPERSITWHQALSLMRSNNLELGQMEDTIEQNERQSLSVYTDMIPGLSYGGYMSRALADLAQPMSSDEMRSHVNVQFYLPTITQIPYRVYEAKANTYASIKQKEGKERELISRLYQLVRRRQIAHAKEQLIKQAPTAEMRESAEQQLQRRRRDNEAYWQDMAKILGLRDARWNIIPESMPKVRWEEYTPRLDKLGELVVCQHALMLERARLLRYRTALNYLPTINTSLYSPALFNSSGGTYGGTFLDAHDTTLSLNISYAVDTKLTYWNDYQRNKAQYEREKIRVADSLMEHRQKIRTLRDSMEEYLNWRSYMIKHMAYLRKQTPQTAEEFMELKKTLYNMEMELLNQEETSIEAEAAIVLEYGMPDALDRSVADTPPASKN